MLQQSVVTNDTLTQVFTGCVDDCKDITFTTGTGYTEEKNCCSTTLCNAADLRNQNGSSTRPTSCFWMMIILVVSILVNNLL